MSTYTEHYKLVKPSYDEDIDIQDINGNMDKLDKTIDGLDFVQNAYTDKSGLHLNKRDGSIIDVHLDYLKLTGGTVTGDAEFTGKLTNNGKDVGQLFKGSETFVPLIDWDKMKEVYGSTMASSTAIVKGVSKTITYPNWCKYYADIGSVVFLHYNKDIYLKDDFTNYDEIHFHATLNERNMILQTWKVSQLKYLFDNYGLVNLTTNNAPFAIVYGFNKYGANTVVSTPRVLKHFDANGAVINIYGVKYGEVK